MSKGYVYILSNQKMPGLVKIGKTTRDVNSRASELFQTGVPAPFKVEYSVLCPDCDLLELAVHTRLEGSRVDPGREFFEVSPKDAENVLDSLHAEQIEEWLNEFLPDHMAVLSDLAVDIGRAGEIAHESGAVLPEIIDAMNEITASEIGPALERVRSRYEKRRPELSANEKLALKLVGET